MSPPKYSFDAKTFPEVVPVLIDVARSDKSASVRHGALDSLSRIRPVSPAAGQTLEWAAAHDESWKVRWQAKTALTRYQWAGYRNAKSDGKTSLPSATQEPPLINAPRPQTKTSAPSRPAVAKTPSQPKGVYSSPPPLPTVVNQPAPKAKVTATPPPIIVDTPATVIAPAPKVPVPAVPVLDLGPRVGTPPVPVVTPPTEPNFRPAGKTPPRAAPPAKTDERGPALTPPM